MTRQYARTYVPGLLSPFIRSGAALLSGMAWLASAGTPVIVITKSITAFIRIPFIADMIRVWRPRSLLSRRKQEHGFFVISHEPVKHITWWCVFFLGFSRYLAPICLFFLLLFHSRRTHKVRLGIYYTTTTAWSVKTRHAPSRQCRDARVYGQKRLRPCMRSSTSLLSSAPPRQCSA